MPTAHATTASSRLLLRATISTPPEPHLPARAPAPRMRLMPRAAAQRRRCATPRQAAAGAEQRQGVALRVFRTPAGRTSAGPRRAPAPPNAQQPAGGAAALALHRTRPATAPLPEAGAGQPISSHGTRSGWRRGARYRFAPTAAAPSSARGTHARNSSRVSRQAWPHMPLPAAPAAPPPPPPAGS
jgi:hypothetical protein